jgi:ribonuclease-3
MPDPPDQSLRAVEKAIGFTFSDRELLERSLVHRSYLAEQDVAASYERLEFLGDAVLQLVVTRFIFDAYPQMSEGEMAKVRAAVVNETVLATIARSWSLGAAVLLGRGEELTGGREKDSILSDACEAVVGAVYLAGGIEAAGEVVLQHWTELIHHRASAPGKADYKTRLQETLARAGKRPEYELTEEGPEHSKRFRATVSVGGEELGSGEGSSKKRAEQEAARVASARLADPDA